MSAPIQPMRPGQPAPFSGEVEIRGPRGAHTGEQRTVVQGHTMPPTPKPGQYYTPAYRAHNGAGNPQPRCHDCLAKSQLKVFGLQRFLLFTCQQECLLNPSYERPFRRW
jgi:hypothetical protein